MRGLETTDLAEHAADPPMQAWRRVRAWLGDAPKGALAELVCRAGFVSRGALYVSLGTVALLAALGLTPEAEGPVGALQGWAEWPAGDLALWLIGLGLYGFALWRVLQSVFDADREGRGPMALFTRAGQAISALVHLALGVGVFALLDALSEFEEHDDAQATQETVAQVLAWPGGAWALIACGVFILGTGIGNFVQAFGRPHKRLACRRSVRRIGGALGRIGHVGRGVAFLPLGYALVQAGRDASASQARGLGAALEALGQGPFGETMLGLTGAGLIAFGLFAFLEARYRRLGAAEVVEELAGGEEAPQYRN